MTKSPMYSTFVLGSAGWRCVSANNHLGLQGWTGAVARGGCLGFRLLRRTA